MSFRDDFDFRESPNFGRRRPPLYGDEPAARPKASRRPPPQRDDFVARGHSVDKLNETTVIGRRRVEGLVVPRSQGRLDVASQRAAVSVGRHPDQHPSRYPSEFPFNRTTKVPLKRPFSAKAIAADRRYSDFVGFPKTIYGTYADVVPGLSGRVRFRIPSQVVPCIQRHMRREVLFAKRHVGSGHSNRGPRRRGPNSNIGC